MTTLTHSTTETSPVRLTLQLEGAAITAAAIWAFEALGGEWGIFALLILAPDLFMLGYLAGKRVGALCYNVAHSYLAPLGLGAAATLAGWDFGVLLALIWGAHIGADRANGYGLKYATHFRDTHMTRV